jgi:DNA-binding transcriptional LysR family regulator
MDLLSLMATFVRVVDAGSLSAAARSEKLSLPAVSRQLRALEDHVGASLVARSTRRLSVTDAGRRWYEHCVRILRDVDEARDDMGDDRVVQGNVVVSSGITLGNALVVPRLKPLVHAHPKLTIELRLEDRLVDLSSEAVDVAVRGGIAPPDSTRVVAHHVQTSRRFAVASPAYLAKRGVPKTPDDLASHCCLLQLREGGTLPVWRFERRGVERTVNVRGAIRTNASGALRDLARDGAGVALLPEWLVESDLKHERLRRILGEWSTAPVTIWALHRTELRGSPRVRAVVDAIARSIVE